MTKSTIKTFLAGGGLLATWLAVNPTPIAPAGSNVAATARRGAPRVVTVDDLNVQEARLRQHLGAMALRPSSRNPFRFGSSNAPAVARPAPAAPVVMMTPPPIAPPPLSLSGIATDAGNRTAIITGEGQLYLVKAGDSVAGTYHVVSVESDAVTLRDDAGVDRRLVLH